MSKVWSERGVSEHAAAREAKGRYQKKEMELEDERTRLARFQGDLRAKSEELARARRGVEKRQLEILNLEREQRTLERAREDLEHQITAQKSRVGRLEHEVEEFREATFRRKGVGG